MAPAGIFHGGNGLGLVVLNAHHPPGLGEEPQEDFQPLRNLRRVAAHQLVVTGDVGLALGAVGDDVANLLRLLHRQLHVGGEACAAHAHNARILHPVQNLLIAQALIVRGLADALGQGVLPVRDNHNGLGHAPGGGGPGLHGLHRAGNGADDVGGDEAAGLGNPLPGQHIVPLGHHRLRRLADMLVGQEHQLPLRPQREKGLTGGKLLALLRMDAPPECKISHRHLSFAVPWGGAA